MTPSDWWRYIAAVYDIGPDDDPSLLPTIGEVDVIYDRMLRVDNVNDEQWPGRCSKFITHPFRSGRAPHSPLVAWMYRLPDGGLHDEYRVKGYESLADHAWAEVSHCGGSGFEEHASWYYLARGSGVFVNVGRTRVFRGHQDAVRFFFGHDCAHGEFSCTEVWQTLPGAALAGGYDSLQFSHHCDLDCDDPAQDLWPGRGDGNGCGYEVMVVQQTPQGALGSGGGSACPPGVELRSGVNASHGCECAEAPLLVSHRGHCISCRGTRVYEAYGGG